MNNENDNNNKHLVKDNLIDDELYEFDSENLLKKYNQSELIQMVGNDYYFKNILFHTHIMKNQFVNTFDISNIHNNTNNISNPSKKSNSNSNNISLIFRFSKIDGYISNIIGKTNSSNNSLSLIIPKRKYSKKKDVLNNNNSNKKIKK